jgi:gamma-glutamylcyclotransferase (GGCT)/AIG2-like uncharacterized protein YtfP
MTTDSPRTRPSRRFLVVLALLISLTAIVGVYFTQIQPGVLTRIDEIEIALPQEPGPHRLFVYGTLRSQLMRFIVTGRMQEAEPAALPGFRRENLNVTRDPDAKVEGYVIHVSDSELRRLDRYERTGQRYERVRVILDDGTSAWVYRLLPVRAPDTPIPAEHPS